MQRPDDLDHYTVDASFDDDPFASPPPGAGKKRKGPDDAGLGIDEEVAVQKRARVPNIKLDEQRLLGPTGIPRLRARAAGLKLKGKGHEFSDAARLLSFYQLWLDDLFPKARFLDALAMVEKAGHKRALQAARQEWISQARPRDDDDANNNNNNNNNSNSNSNNNNNNDDDDDISNSNVNNGNGNGNDDGERSIANVQDGLQTHQATAQFLQQRAREGTPTARAQQTTIDKDVPDDDDLYDATPKATRTLTRRNGPADREDENDDDDLQALMAEAGLLDDPHDHDGNANINDEGRGIGRENHNDEEEEDLDALIAEAEAQEVQRNMNHGTGDENGDGNENGRMAGGEPERDEFADDEDAMREMEGW